MNELILVGHVRLVMGNQILYTESSILAQRRYGDTLNSNEERGEEGILFQDMERNSFINRDDFLFIPGFGLKGLERSWNYVAFVQQ